MKKILSFIFVLLAAFVLVACADEGTLTPTDSIPTPDESQLVQMSPEQIITLLQEVSYEELMTQVVRFHVSGTMHMRNTDSYDDWYYDYETSEYVDYVYTSFNEVQMTINANLFVKMTEMVEDAQIILTGTINMQSQESSNWYNELYEEDVAASGSMNVYLYNQQIYVNPDMTVTENGETETLQFKQKLNELLTQEMYDDMIEGLLEQVGYMSDIDLEEIEDLVESGDFEGVLAVVPNLKVYQDGNVITINFELTKQDILDSAVDFMLAVFDSVGEERPPQSEIDAARDELTDMINAFVETFQFKYSIRIVGQMITRIAIEVQAKIDNDDDVYLDIDMTYIWEFGVEMPALPTDLDTYEAVDDFDMFD